jgi:hypothetical protein
MTATPLGNLGGEFWRMSVQPDLASGGCPSDGARSFALFAKGRQRVGRRVTAVTTGYRNRQYSCGL